MQELELARSYDLGMRELQTEQEQHRLPSTSKNIDKDGRNLTDRMSALEIQPETNHRSPEPAESTDGQLQRWYLLSFFVLELRQSPKSLNLMKSRPFFNQASLVLTHGESFG